MQNFRFKMTPASRFLFHPHSLPHFAIIPLKMGGGGRGWGQERDKKKVTVPKEKDMRHNHVTARTRNSFFSNYWTPRMKLAIAIRRRPMLCK